MFVGSSGALVVMKLLTVLVGMGIFLHFRHHRITELACWTMFVVYTGLAFAWLAYLAEFD